ncbi:hypothetical protein JCM8547_006991 [Rhodosporidiobolus lusitaniae]
METEEALFTTLPPSPPPSTPHARPYIEPAILLASSLSAVSARLVCHPLDTLRIRVQTAGPVVPPLRQLVKGMKVQQLYAGLPVAIAFSVPALSVYLQTYEASKRYFSDLWLPQDREAGILRQLPVFLAAGTAAELASGAIWTPLDVLKSRLQRGQEGTSAIALIRKIVREEGWLGLQRGYLVSTAIFIPNCSVYWMLYEVLKTRFVPGYSSSGRPSSSSTPPSNPDSPPPSSSSLLPKSLPNVGGIPIALRYTFCSVTACAVAATISTPIEVVNARWQTSGGKIKGGVSEIVREAYRQGGVRAFTRGMGVRIAYAIPANAIAMSTYESVKRYYDV